MADCSDFLYAAAFPWKCVPEKIANNAIADLAKTLMESYDALLKNFMTSWLGKGIMVNLDGISVQWFTESTSIITLFLVTIGLMLAGLRTFMSRSGQAIGTVAKQLFMVVFIASAGSLIAQVFIIGGDAYGQWIINNAGLDVTSFVVAVELATKMTGLAIVLGFFGILAVLCQWVLMFIRGALLPLLIGFWPVGAAAAMVESKSKMFDAITAWIIAFIIYNPVAASIYALAWRLKGGDDGLSGVINGWTLVILAVVALPAILRLVTPAAQAMGKMAGGAMAMGITAGAVSAGVAVGAAVATGGASAAGKGAATAGKTTSSAQTAQNSTTSGASTSSTAGGGTGEMNQGSGTNASAQQASQGGSFSNSGTENSNPGSAVASDAGSGTPASASNSQEGAGVSSSAGAGASTASGRRAARPDNAASTASSGAPSSSKPTGTTDSATSSNSGAQSAAATGSSPSAPNGSEGSHAASGTQGSGKNGVNYKHLAGTALEGAQNAPKASNAAEGLISDE